MAGNVLILQVLVEGPQIILQSNTEIRFSVAAKLRLEYRDATEAEVLSSIYSAHPDDPDDEQAPRKTLTVWVEDTSYVYSGVPFLYAQPCYELLVQYVR